MGMNSIVELILFILGFIIAKQIEKNMPDVGEKTVTEKSSDKPLVNIYVEQFKDIYYAWEDDKKFLFQHEDAKEMARMLLKKYPNHEVKINEKVIETC
jgi:hypothetical protein